MTLSLRIEFWVTKSASSGGLGGATPRRRPDPPPPLSAGFWSTFGLEGQNGVRFLHGSENIDFDIPYSFFFFGFLSHCYGRGDAAGF